MSGRVDDLRKEQALQYNIRDLWAELGCGPLTSSGMAFANALGREETEPSVQVGGAKNIAYDHGSKKSYDAIALVQCVKGCSFPEALDYLVGPDADLIPSKSNGKPYSKPKGHVTTVYDYRDEMGNLLFQVLRYDPKGFSQRTLGEDGQWVYKLNGVRRILYRLPELLKAVHEGKQVFIVEGEQDANNLHRIGLTATTCSQGAGKWQPEYSASLRGARVVILPDNDEPGRKHAEAVAQSLHGIATEVKVVELPGLALKCDVSDWLAVGNTREELEGLVAKAPVWEAQEPTFLEDIDKPLFHLTDLGNSERFVNQHRKDVRYCYAQNSWLVWDGKMWRRDADGAVMALGKQTAISIYNEVSDAPTKEQREELVRHAKVSESRRSISDMLILAQNEVAIRPERLDSEQWLLPLQNGTYDLREDRFREHRREDYFTHLAPVAFDGEADCPKFLEFLNKIMERREDVISFLQRLFGVCLTGDTGCQKMFIFWGGGQNGKTTLIETILGVLGPFATRIDTEILLAQKFSVHPTGLTDLYGTRLAWTSESGDGRRLAEDLVKSLTGGDRIRARRMRENFFEWSPTHKLLLLTNHRPVIRGRDFAIWRRICLVPFTYKVPTSERIENYEKILLREERSGILNWMLDGLRTYQETGLNEPEEVKAAVEEYQRDEDVIGPWLEECCLLGSDYHSKASDLWKSYEEHCQESATDPLSKPVFWRLLTDRGITADRINKSRLRSGIGIKK